MIFDNRLLLEPASLPLDRVFGDYAFYDDGWRCRLSLRPGEQGAVEAHFFSYDRTQGSFAARVAVDSASVPRLEISVAHFNELDEQVYVGYAFTRGVQGIAGASQWKSEPFGFFARRHPPVTQGPQLPVQITPQDFTGSFNLYCDGLRATMLLTDADGATVRGMLVDDAGTTRPVTATIDPDVRHQAIITIDDVAEMPCLSVWMFSRQRTALAGWLDWGGKRFGCYLTRFEWRREEAR
jgi:hypothetical protein